MLAAYAALGAIRQQNGASEQRVRARRPVASTIIVDTTARALLSQVMIGLGTIADAYDRLLDLEVVAYACQVADRMEGALGAILAGLHTREDVVFLQGSIAELQAIAREHAGPDARKDDIRRLARTRWNRACVEIDARAEVVEGDGGAYVGARVWVSFDGTQLERRRE